MAASDATPMPVKNQAYRVTFPIFDADGDLVSGAASLDSEVSKDGGTFTDCTNEATEIATSSGMYYLDLTSSEMNADTVAVIVKTSTSGAKTTPIVLYPVEDGDIPVNVTDMAAAIANEIADALLKRAVSNVEDTADTHSLAAVILAILEWSITESTWTIKKTTGETFDTKTVTTDVSGVPVTGVT